jgi:uncharacterized protein YqeY
MSIAEQINQDIKKAMLAKEKDKLEALRSVKAALLLEASKDGSNSVPDEKAVSILQKLVKQRNESAEIYKQQNREEMAAEEEFQAQEISKYLPEMMSEEEVILVVKEIINQTGASSPAEMGKVMGPAMGKLKGKADGALVSKVVKDCLS